MNTGVVQSSMKLFKRKSHDDHYVVEPSSHVAFIGIKNEHFEIDEMYDLSDLTFTELSNVVEYADFQRELRNATGEDFNFGLNDDDEEVQVIDDDEDTNDN